MWKYQYWKEMPKNANYFIFKNDILVSDIVSLKKNPEKTFSG